MKRLRAGLERANITEACSVSGGDTAATGKVLGPQWTKLIEKLARPQIGTA